MTDPAAALALAEPGDLIAYAQITREHTETGHHPAEHTIYGSITQFARDTCRVRVHVPLYPSADRRGNATWSPYSLWVQLADTGTAGAEWARWETGEVGRLLFTCRPHGPGVHPRVAAHIESKLADWHAAQDIAEVINPMETARRAQAFADADDAYTAYMIACESMRVCVVEGCTDAAATRLLCRAHAVRTRNERT